MKDSIAIAGLRRVDAERDSTPIARQVMTDPSLSLEAKGLYAMLASYQGQPIDPYESRVEDATVISAAIEELLAAGLAVRVWPGDHAEIDDDADQDGPFSDRLVRLVSSRYPPFDQISAAEFEGFVADLLRASGVRADRFQVELHETIAGGDGDYDFDAVARYEVLGLEHILLIEAKRHRNPIKRELVQALHAKLSSVGAQKALLVAACRFQSGAVRYALAHGIALATVSEGRWMFETRSAEPTAPMTQAEAAELGLEPVGAMAITQLAGSSSISSFRLSPDDGEALFEWVTNASE